MDMMRFDRCIKLFGADFEKLQKTRVLIFGVGGVGGLVVDCLYRSGIGHITIVDKDTYEITNQNRQIGSHRLGEIKVDVLSDIYKGIIGIQEVITEESLRQFDKNSYDFVLDCIDDVKAKVATVNYFGADKVISSLGSAKRIDATKIRVGDIKDVNHCVFGKKFRRELQKSGYTGNLKVIYSDEPQYIKKEKGSFCGITGAFGLFICSEVIKAILGKIEHKKKTKG